MKYTKRVKHKLQFFKDSRKKWRYRFRAVNGNILCTSEAYYSIRNAKKSAYNLIQSIQIETISEEICK